MREITTGDLMHVYGGFDRHVDYTVRLTVRMTESVDEDILTRALARTQRRYPYFLRRIRRGESSLYYEKNDLPVVLLKTNDKISLNTEEVNYHLWAVCCFRDYIHLDVYHGMTDGTGMYHVLSTLLYYYCEERYGVTDHEGIRLAGEPIAPEETDDPQDHLSGLDISGVPQAQWKDRKSVV